MFGALERSNYNLKENVQLDMRKTHEENVEQNYVAHRNEN